MIEAPKKCAVIGSPINHSLSPLIHNEGFKVMNLNFEYQTLEAKNPKEAVNIMIEDSYRGFSVTLPLKISLMKYLDEIEPIAESIGAINTIVNESGSLKGYNTDVSGSIRSIKDVMLLNEKSVLLIGSGGAARAIGFGLKKERAEITIMNRTLEKAKSLAKSLDSTFIPFTSKIEQNFDLIINATSVGLSPQNNESIINDFPNNCIVMDIVYCPLTTKLLQLALERKCKIIRGTEMFLYQAAEQFRLFTGKVAPINVMRKKLLEKLS